MRLQDSIRKVRQKVFLSQEAFAKELSVSPSTITRWETGKGKPNLSALKRISVFCSEHDLSFDDIEAAWFSESNAEASA